MMCRGIDWTGTKAMTGIQRSDIAAMRFVKGGSSTMVEYRLALGSLALNAVRLLMWCSLFSAPSSSLARAPVGFKV